MSRTIRLLPLFALATFVAACSGAPTATTASSPPGSAPSSAPPSAAPTESAAGSIEHETGATDVVLRYEEGGGFVMPMFLATQVPHFTLYGDGTVIFRNPALEVPPAEGALMRQNPLRTARLDERQIQDILQYALTEGGLAVARPNYPNDQVADASNTTFTLRAGGIEKKVDIYALGMDLQGGADAPARASFSRLAERLKDFDNGGAIPTDVYEPERFRGVLIDNGGFAPPDTQPWPWKDLKPADFVAGLDADALPLPSRTMTDAELGELGLENIQGGVQGLSFNGPGDGKTYSFALRPLLPDDEP
jgi:hypothetical protein